MTWVSNPYAVGMASERLARIKPAVEKHVGEGKPLHFISDVGPGARVRSGAVLVQSVVASGGVVESGTVLNRAFAGRSNGNHGPAMEEDASPAVWGGGHDGLAAAPPSGRLGAMAKRAFDLLVSSLGLLLLAPVSLLIVAMIKLESRGPAHFAHVREGRGGRTFRCWKFRTMVQGAHGRQRRLADANQVDGPQFKIDEDPRRTRLGRLLTATNLDELPQLWNVLVGQMSLVGPRPSPFRENQLCVPWREARLAMKASSA